MICIGSLNQYMKIILTATEYELMSIIWNLGQASIREVMDHLPVTRKLAYTSVATIIRILEKKKILYSRMVDRKHIFIPKVSKSEFIKQTTSEIISELFDNNPVELVTYLLKENKLSNNELVNLKNLILTKKK